VFNFSADFDAKVVEPYVASYAAAETPNPCVDCNRTMKFGRALARARQLGFDYVATGHHARIVATPYGSAIARGTDRAKDQSYVLYMLGRAELDRTLLPVGEMTKVEVRDRARASGLRTASKRESMDVCFITRGGRAAFLGARIPRRPGAVVDDTGRVVGRHHGIDAFTIGQRRGLHVAADERRYVVDIDPASATVVVGTKEQLERREVRLRDLVLVRPPPRSMTVQTRAHGEPVAASLDGTVVRFAEPQSRVAPGQVVACYDGDVLLGGGIAAS
jgi:tRNA-specific 2-thiouridylase